MKAIILKKYILLLFVAICLFTVFIYLEKYNVEFSSRLNSEKGLSEQSIHVLKNLHGTKAIKIEVYTNKTTAISKTINKFFIPYKRINKDINIEFVDPVSHSSKVQQNAITMQGEMLLTFLDNDNTKSIHITELSESAIINAILRLLNDTDEWLIMAEGYGMANVEDDSGSGLSDLLIHLKKVGVHIARMPLNSSLVLPDNVKVILLPNPKEKLDTEIVNWIQQQMQQGISFWWLNDVNAARQAELELLLDIMSGSKTLIDSEYSSVITEYPMHAITENFNQPIYIAEGIEIIASSWATLIRTENNTSIAVAKQFDKSRVVITGDSDILSNQYLNAVANKSMVFRTIDWLFYHDDRINIPVQINKHTQLVLSQIELVILSVIFLLLIPLILLLMAWKKWRKSRA